MLNFKSFIEKKDLINQAIFASPRIDEWNIFFEPKGKRRSRVTNLERDITIADEIFLTKITIGYTNLGSLTTFDRAVLTAIIEIWAENQRQHPVIFNFENLLRKINLVKKVDDFSPLVESLMKLLLTPVMCEYSIYDLENDEEATLEVNPLTILSQFKKPEHNLGTCISILAFNPLILSNLKKNS